MPKELETVTLEKSKGQPTVEVIFGQAHLGNYRFFLWDADGKNPAQLSHGNNIDDIPDKFTIAESPDALNRCILSYEILIQSAEARAGQTYSVTITVRQKGDLCKGGAIVETGVFEDVKSIVGFRRLIL